MHPWSLATRKLTDAFLDERSELNNLRPIMNAGHQSQDRQPCLRRTRTSVLAQIEGWEIDTGDNRIFWLNGLAGTGKSTIAQTFAERSSARGRLGASFFCSRFDEGRSNISRIFPTIAHQLALWSEQYRWCLLSVIHDIDAARESPYNQAKALLVDPLEESGISCTIVIDALDECKDDQPASAILSILSRFTDRIPRVKFFITGRPESQIRSGFRLPLLRPITTVLKLHEVLPRSVDSDIRLFLETQIVEIAKRRSDCRVSDPWPSTRDLDVLCQKSGGLFIYAATVVKYIDDRYQTPQVQLFNVVGRPSSTIEEGKSGLDRLYHEILKEAFEEADADDNAEIFQRFRAIVGTIVLLTEPVSRSSLGSLLASDVNEVSSRLRHLHALLAIPDDDQSHVLILHKSFPDFLTDPLRCRDHRFFIHPSSQHRDISLSCFALMESNLRRNMCGIPPYASDGDVSDLPELRKVFIGDGLEYACRFWAHHGTSVTVEDEVETVLSRLLEFLKTKFLYWVEVLSISKDLGRSLYILDDARAWATRHVSGFLQWEANL